MTPAMTQGKKPPSGGEALSPTQSEALAAGDGGLTRPSEPAVNTAS